MTVAMIVSIIIFLIIVYSGYVNGLFGSVAVLFMLVIALSAAMGFYVPVSAQGFLSSMGPYGPSICMLAVFMVSFFVLQALITVVAPPAVRLSKPVDKLGGIGVSVVTGVLMTGFVMTAFFMLPWTEVKENRLVAFGSDALFTKAFGILAARTGGTEFNADRFWSDLIAAESDRECVRNLSNLIEPLQTFYETQEGGRKPTERELWSVLAKEVGEDNMVCGRSGKPFKLIPIRNVPYRSDRNKPLIQVYDTEPSHLVDGKPAYMVLFVYKGGQPVEVQGLVQVVPQEQFEKELQAELESPK